MTLQLMSVSRPATAVMFLIARMLGGPGEWGGEEERRGRWRHEPVPLCGGVLLPCLAPETTPGMRDFPGEGRGDAFLAKCRGQDWGHP